MILPKEGIGKDFLLLRKYYWIVFKNRGNGSKSRGELTGLTTGFIDIDNKLSGMQKSDLILLAARPSMGKTALGGINIAVNSAIKAEASVAVFFH